MAESLLECLPADIILMILDFSGSKPFAWLSSCNKALRKSLGPLVYRHNVRFEHSSAALWAVLQCRKNDVSWRVIEASVLAGMDVLTTLHKVRVNDTVPRSIASTLAPRLRLSYARLSLFAIAVIKGRDSLVLSFVSQPAEKSLTSHPLGLSIDTLASPEVIRSLGSLFVDKLLWSNDPNPLIVASASGLSSVVRHILDNEGNAVNSLDANGRTPLYYAVASPLRTVATVEQLLRKGADVHVWFDWHGMPSMMTYACLNGLFHLTRSLLEYDIGGDLQSLLRLALQTKAKAVRGGTKSHKWLLVEELVRRGADPNGLVPVMGAGEGIRPLIVDLALTSKLGLETLLEIEGVDVNVEDSSGHTALSWVLSEEHCDPPAAEFLLKHGAKLQPQSFDWITKTLKFSTLEKLEWLLLRKRTTFKALRVLYRHCTSNPNMDDTMASFLESISPESTVLAGMSKYEIRDIERGKIGPLKPWFRIGLSLDRPPR